MVLWLFIGDWWFNQSVFNRNLWMCRHLVLGTWHHQCPQSPALALAASTPPLSKTWGFTEREEGRQVHTDTNNAFKYNDQNEIFVERISAKKSSLISQGTEPHQLMLWFCCHLLVHTWYCFLLRAFWTDELFYGIVVSTSCHLNPLTRSLWDWDDPKCVTQGRLFGLTKVTFDVREANQNVGHYLRM